MNSKILFLGSLLLVCTHQVMAQRNYDGYNFLGIMGGISFFDIHTSDFATKPGQGFSAGFTSRGAFRNDFDLIYGINFQHSILLVVGEDEFNSHQEIEYTIQGVQINFLGSYNIVPKYFSLEFGPVFHINSKMKLNSRTAENYILRGSESLKAKDIQDISRFDLRVVGGLTVGIEHFRLSGQYQYGVTNILGHLNKNDLEKDNFKGNSSTIILSAIIYF